jgi:hypothetical protein
MTRRQTGSTIRGAMRVRPTDDRGESMRYRIVVGGAISERFLEPLPKVAVESIGEESVLACEVRDQTELHGVLAWLYDRGIVVVSVNPIKA